MWTSSSRFQVHIQSPLSVQIGQWDHMDYCSYAGSCGMALKSQDTCCEASGQCDPFWHRFYCSNNGKVGFFRLNRTVLEAGVQSLTHAKWVGFVLHFKSCFTGARLAFGGKELQNHTIPKVYGAIEPTAVFVPLTEILKDDETFKTATTEVFGPLQVCGHVPPSDISLCLSPSPFISMPVPFTLAFQLHACAFQCYP